MNQGSHPKVADMENTRDDKMSLHAYSDEESTEYCVSWQPWMSWSLGARGAPDLR